MEEPLIQEAIWSIRWHGHHGISALRPPEAFPDFLSCLWSLRSSGRNSALPSSTTLQNTGG